MDKQNISRDEIAEAMKNEYKLKQNYKLRNKARRHS
mgnify:CR=1 FL=1